MELRQLEFVVVLAEELHFGRAARRMHVSTPVLSDQIRRLEREIGTPLFERNTHRVSLTSAGQGFLIEARSILRATANAVEAARTPQRRTQLRIIVCEPIFDMAFDIASVITTAMPEVTLEIDAVPVDQIMARFADGTVDLAVSLPPLIRQRRPDVTEEPLRLSPVGVCVGKAHPLASRDAVRLADVVDEQVMLAPEGYSEEYNTFVTGIFTAAGLTLRPVPNEARSLHWVLPALVATGRCVVIVPDGVRAGPDVVWLPFAESLPPFRWTLLTARRDDALVGAAADALTRYARTHHWWEPLG